VIEQALTHSGVTGLRHLSIIYLLKQAYGASGHIHSTSNQALSKLSHIAGRTRLRKAITYGIAMGWIKRLQDGSIILPTFTTIHGDTPKQKELVEIETNQNHNELLDYFFELTFRTRANRSDYCSSTSQSLNEPKTSKEYKSALKRKKKIYRLRREHGQAWEERGFNKSYLGFAKLYQVSITQSFYLIQSLIKKGIVSKRNNVKMTEIPNHILDIPEFCINMKNFNKHYRKGHNGFLIQQLPNSYSLLTPKPMN
jgi:hypothetical protein